jgi:hypothetical protein
VSFGTYPGHTYPGGPAALPPSNTLAPADILAPSSGFLLETLLASLLDSVERRFVLPYTAATQEEAWLLETLGYVAVV